MYHAQLIIYAEVICVSGQKNELKIEWKETGNTNQKSNWKIPINTGEGEEEKQKIETEEMLKY